MRTEPPHALIVDDDPEVHNLAVAVLAAFGYVVHCAWSAAEAFRLSARTMPDLLLTSVMLPDTNGLALASQLRARSTRLAVIYMSAGSDPVRVSGALHAGGGSLRKPFGPEQLAGEVTRLVERRPAACAQSADEAS